MIDMEAISASRTEAGSTTVPLSEGDVIDLVVTDTGDQGDGVAKVGNLAIFVLGAALGDVVAARIVQICDRYAVAVPIVGYSQNISLSAEPAKEVVA